MFDVKKVKLPLLKLQNKGYKKIYEEPKGQRRRKFSRKCKRKGKNSQHGKPQQTRDTAVESLSSGSQSEEETESGENVSSTKFYMYAYHHVLL